MSEIKIQSGIIISGPGIANIEHNLAIPSPDAGQLLIKTRAIGLNTPDWMALDKLGRPGAGLGFDFAGEVVEIGDRCENWTVGDRVAGLIHACMLSSILENNQHRLTRYSTQVTPQTMRMAPSGNIY